ncbi:hypothetical protein R4Z09_12280 [Niallia oryzisoli]|uniref:Uncharacterized protein n=1 Tax=Niallia oryzisoli TaxID=1737571 RepID=A0ABZ2CKT9_9BACI
MNNSCLYCHKEIGEWYRVNEQGDVFCHDDCYDNNYHTSNVEYTDWKHPYIDDYEAIRSTYLDWPENWENDLDVDPEINNLQYLLDTMIDKIDEVYAAYWDYYRAEGDDGVFAWEIYSYLLKFEKLQEKMLHWRPENREVFFYLSVEICDDDMKEEIKDSYDFLTYLNLKDHPEIFDLLKDHVHPYDIIAYYFETEEELVEVVKKLEETFRKEMEIYYDKAYQCEGECADIEVIDNVTLIDTDGWFFCCSCESQFYPGFYSKEELEKEIQECNKILESRDRLGYSTFYLRKIQRSCRYHHREYPGTDSAYMELI